MARDFASAVELPEQDSRGDLITFLGIFTYRVHLRITYRGILENEGAWVVSVVCRLVEVENQRDVPESRTDALETRVSEFEQTGGPGAQQAQWRIQLVDQRLTELERRQAHRRAVSWWPNATTEQPPDQSTHPR